MLRPPPERDNLYAHALLLGEAPARPLPPRAAAHIELVQSDAASYLEACPAGSFDGFTLSNILDGAEASYRDRLFAAVRRAAAPERSWCCGASASRAAPLTTNRAEDDRSMLWGIVDVRRVAEL